MQPYIQLIERIIYKGDLRKNRTGIDTVSVFGHQSRYDLTMGFPLLTLKKMHTKSIIHELLWFIKGDTNIKYLQENGVRIWDEWADANGDLGPVYGKQWRDFGGVDQLTDLIHQIKTNPDSRRLIISSWNPPEIPFMKLPPCHCLVQFYVQDGQIDCQLYQRSADVFLGVPFNIASYALLTHMIAKVCNLRPRHFVHTLGDAHIYVNHMESCLIMIDRPEYCPPTLKLSPVESIFDFTATDIAFHNYQSHPAIKADVAV